MATLWRVSRAGSTMPMLMKVPKIAEGADPAAIVRFEMEQMIMPRLSGVHVPKFVAAGDFAVQPYLVMERIAGNTLLPRLSELPLPYPEVADIGVKIAAALDAYGLSHHDQLPDLMQEEFHLPFGTAPYMSPEQLLGVRND